MAKLTFRVSADWKEVQRLREEVARLKKELVGMDTSKFPAQAKELGKSIKEADSRIKELSQDATEAGMKIEKGFKKKIFDASAVVNDFSQKITKQRGVIHRLKSELDSIKDKYRFAVKSGDNTSNLEKQIARASAKLAEHKNILFDLTQKQAGARLAVKRLRDEYALFKNDAAGTSASVSGLGLNLSKSVAFLGGGAIIKGLAQQVVAVRGQFQQMETSIQTLLGSKEKADALFSKVKEYAKVSPLDLKSITSATQMMLGFNIEAEKTSKYIQAIGDISMGDAGRFHSLTLAFSQMSAAGKLMGQDLLQMINVGFNPLTIMAEKTGKSVAQLKEEMSKGAISAEMVQQAFIDATSAGGKFYKMSENASKTISGRLSMLQDAMDNMFNSIGESSEGAIGSAVSVATSLVENYEKVGKILAGLVATYGAYRTAVMLSTVATSGHTIAEVALTNVRVVARKAQMLLNASMLSNPYVLLATTIVGLVATVWSLHDSTSAATRAQNEYNKKKEETIEKETEHKRRIDELLSSARDESLATLTRQQSLDELRKEYPKIFEQYDTEKLKLQDILALKKQINEEDANRSVKARQKDYVDLQKEIGDQKRYLALVDNSEYRQNMSDDDMRIWKKYAGTAYVEVRDKMKKNVELLDRYQKDVLDDSLASYKTTLDGYTKERLEMELKAAEDALARGDKFNIGGVNVRKKALENVIDVLRGSIDGKSKEKTYGEDYRARKKEWEDAKKELEKIEKDKDKFTTKQREDAEKRMKAAKEAFEGLGGKTSETKTSKTPYDVASATARLKEEDARRLLDLSRRNQDVLIEIEQQEINTLNDGSEKTIRQRELNNRKEIQAIKRQKEEYISQLISNAKERHESEENIKANTIKGYKKKSFDASSVNTDTKEAARFDDLIAKTRARQDRDAYSSLVKDYQSYTDKRVEIEQKFNEDIEQLRAQRANAEASKDEEAMQMLGRSIAKATSDKGKALAEHDFKVLRESPDYSRAFDDLKTTSSETLRTLIAELERYKAQASSSLNPANLKVYTDAIRQMYDELDSRNPFNALARNMEELSKAESNLRQAKKTLEDVRNGIKIGNGISQDKATGKTKVSYLSEEEALKRVNASMDEYLRLFALADKSRKTAVEQVKQLGASLSQLGGTIGGIQGEILGFVGDFTSFIASSVDGIKTIGKTGSDAISAVEKASIILSIISSAIQIMKKLSDFIPDAHDQYKKIEEKERSIAKLTSAVNDYKRAVIEARHEDENWFSGDKLKGLEDSAELYNNAREAYEKKLSEKQAAYVDEGVKSWLGKDITNDFILEMMAKKRAGDGSARANLRIETRKKYNGFLGTGIGGHNQETANLEEWVRKNFGGAELFDKDNNINRKLVKEILDKFGDKLVGQTKDTLEELDKLQEQIDRHQEALRNYVVESYSPLIDDMTDGIIEWLDTGKDALDSFRDHAGETFRAIKRDLIRSLVTTAIFGTGEDSFQNKIAKLYGLKAKGEITKEEMSRKIAELTKELQDKTAKELPAIKELSDAVDNALSKVGIDVSEKDKLTQDSTKRGFETMTQEQAGELNGRFTTLVVLGEETKNLHTLTNDWLSKIYAKLPNKDLPDIGEQNKSIISSGRIGVQVVFPEDKLNNIVLEIGQLRASVMDMQRLHSETLIETREISDASSAIVRQGKEIASNTDIIKRNTSKL